MKITKLDFKAVNPKWTLLQYHSSTDPERQKELAGLASRWTILRVHTDEGIVGYGEPVVEGRARTVLTAVRELEPFLIGQDPRRIEHLWQAMYRGTFYRGGPILVSAISGVEQALWDIFGKSVGLPIYQLLGGPTRSRIRMYAHLWTDTPEAAAQGSRQLVAQGFTAIKTGFPAPIRIVDTPAQIERFVAIVEAMRVAVGDEVDIAIDFHGRFSPAMAIRLLKELEPYRPMWAEEPCLPENVDAMVTIARSTSIPIATGERLYTKWGFREAIEKQAAVVYQPDLSHAGGISECKKIAAMAEAYYAGVAPHCPLGPIALAACIQLDACIPNFVIQEQVTFGEGLLKKPFQMVDGYVDVPTLPGLGVEVDEDALVDLDDQPWWHVPTLVHRDDQSVGDW
jgi:galactonate dehydratase